MLDSPQKKFRKSQEPLWTPFEEYYHGNVVMILEDGTEVKGKDANRDRKNSFFKRRSFLRYTKWLRNSIALEKALHELEGFFFP